MIPQDIPFPVVALPQVKLTGELGLDNPGGVALRFARVVRYRPELGPV